MARTLTELELEALVAWRADHPARPLPRDAEQRLLDEVVHLQAGRDEDTARLAELADKVARLRAENEQQARTVAYLRSCTPPTHPSHYGYEAWVERLRAEVAAERAAVVAWLKKQRVYCMGSTGEPNAATATYAHAADAIERGKHRREEE